MAKEHTAKHDTDDDGLHADTSDETGTETVPAETSETTGGTVSSDEVQDAPREPAAPVGPVHEAGKTPMAVPRGGLYRRLWQWAAAHKKFSIPAAAVLVLAIVAAVPLTRYVLAGMVLRQNFSVTVIDSETQKPVTGATVLLAGKEAATNNKGSATLRAHVGTVSLQVSKKYYRAAQQNVLVPIGKQKQPQRITLVATGRQVPLTITNSISGKPVANVVVKVLGAESKTDSKGEAVVVVPAGKATVEASLSGTAYNAKKVTVTVTTAADPANRFTVTPVGKVYFLSNLSGTLDVVKTNLDGSERQVVLAGTGKEDKPSTVLLASRDWKYIALLSKRDGGDTAKLFLIDTSTDQTITMDEGDANFSPYGWSGHRFIYGLDRTKLQYWEAKKRGIKSYDAETKKLTVLDETAAEGTESSGMYEWLGQVYIFDQEIVFSKSWNSVGYMPPAQYESKQLTLYSIRADGSQKKTIKGYPLYQSGKYLDTSITLGDLNELYIRYYKTAEDYDKRKPSFEEYADGKLDSADISDAAFGGDYNTYLVSPSGKKTFWTEFRDGKNVFFVGDGDGKNGKQFTGASDEYTAYGWLTDEYVLVARKNSEMRIMPADGLPDGVEGSQKISDYYKPNYNNRGYGYGYGG